MRSIVIAVSLILLSASAAVAATGAGPETIGAAAVIPPDDQAYPGVIRLSVDATDTDRRIFRIHETVPVSGGKEAVLLYPEWLPGTHGPDGRSRINKFAGLVITVNGARVNWTRDPAYVYAFHVAVPEGAVTLDIDFQYLSPVGSQANGAEVSDEILILEWSSVVLYPAGYFARQIGVEASVKLPDGWQFATALERAPGNALDISFNRASLETLVDSPIFAGRSAARWELDPDSATPVRLNVFADRPELLAVKPEQLAAHRSLVQQAYRLFGSKHYDHYDFLVSLSDHIRFGGLEHHRSSEDATQATYFTEWGKTIASRALLPHEFVHSWNGKFRRPADLWTPNYNVPMRDSLLWVYEGQTEYWGQVLAARAGLVSKEQALDALASIAAYYKVMAGRTWRPLEDTTSDEIINPREIPIAWASWQRYKDYYSEGLLIWLDADTLIRELSHGERSLDDFARRFFGTDDGSLTPVTYAFDDVVSALNDVQSCDWASFLKNAARCRQPGAARRRDRARRLQTRL
jgi:predicted metalloprotease with PDZ domain